jgi:hypothetical protein
VGVSFSAAFADWEDDWGRVLDFLVVLWLVLIALSVLAIVVCVIVSIWRRASQVLSSNAGYPWEEVAAALGLDFWPEPPRLAGTVDGFDVRVTIGRRPSASTDDTGSMAVRAGGIHSAIAFGAFRELMDDDYRPESLSGVDRIWYRVSYPSLGADRPTGAGWTGGLQPRRLRPGRSGSESGDAERDLSQRDMADGGRRAAARGLLSGFRRVKVTDSDITVEHEPWDRSLDRALLAIDRMVEAASVMTGVQRRREEKPPEVGAEPPAREPLVPSGQTGGRPDDGAGRITAPPPGEVAGALFVPSRSSFDTEELFASQYEGRKVFWRGTLKRVMTVRSDVDFGRGPGTKASVTVYRLSTGLGLSGGRDVEAVV